MNSDVKIYLLLRGLRWLAWIAFFLYCMHFVLVRTAHFDSFGRLLTSSEVWLFGIPLFAVFLGCFELRARGVAGLRQPQFFELVPEPAPALAHR